MEDRYLIISDLDGTLLGDDEALAHFARWVRQRSRQLRLVYNSGRLVQSILESIESTELPEPDAVIGGVGTQMMSFHSNQPIDGWLKICDGWEPLKICSMLAEYDELELQPPEFLSDHKVSYFAEDISQELLDEIRSRLAAASCRVEIVYSSNRDLDVLPRGVDKGSASAWLASRWSYSHERVIVSGDTGNDLAMFENGFRGIVVGNAHRELKRLNSSLVFQAKQTHAAGVLEGLAHWMN